jgi:hypothetical protein
LEERLGRIPEQARRLPRLSFFKPDFRKVALFVDGLAILAHLRLFERNRFATDGALDERIKYWHRFVFYPVACIEDSQKLLGHQSIKTSERHYAKWVNSIRVHPVTF